MSTKKIAKHKGLLTFFYTTPSTMTPVCDSSPSTPTFATPSVPRKNVYAVLTDKKMELFETQQPFSLPDMICQSPIPTPLSNKAQPFISLQQTQLQHQQQEQHAGLSALTATQSSGNTFQNLIMINENHKPSEYDSNVGLVGKIYLCPHLCGGRVQVARSGRRGFKVIVTCETPKTSPELNMNHELLTPTSAVQTPYETPISPKSPYFHSTHNTSSDCSTPNINSMDCTPAIFNMSNEHVNSQPLKQQIITKESSEDNSAVQISITSVMDGSDEDGDVQMSNQVPSPHDDGHENRQIYGTSRGKFMLNKVNATENQSHASPDSGDRLRVNSLISYLNSDQQDQSLYFLAPTETECDEWMMHIQQVLSSLNNRYAYLLDEILLYIFSFLDAVDLSKSISPASCKFMSLAKNEILWNNLYIAKWKKKEYSILYYSAMLNISTPPYLTKMRRRKTGELEEQQSNQLVTWKYVYTKRFELEKQFLHKEATQQTPQQQQQQEQTEVTTNDSLSVLSPGEVEKRRKEEEERRKKEEEERNKALSSEYLKDGNTLFNAADAERDVATKRLLWVFCIDCYDACLMFNPTNWTAARNWAVALIRLEKLVNTQNRAEVQAYLRMILNLCVSKFEDCIKLTPNNDEVLTLWAGFLSDLALKIHDPIESDRLFKEAHKKFDMALAIKPYIGTYNDYGISYCDMAEKKIRQLKRKLYQMSHHACCRNQQQQQQINNSCSRYMNKMMMIGDDEEDVDEVEDEDVACAYECHSGGSTSDEESTTTSLHDKRSSGNTDNSCECKQCQFDESQIIEQRDQILACLEGSSRMYEKCLVLQPDYFHAINNMGYNQKLKIDLIRIQQNYRRMSRMEQNVIAQQRQELVREACEFFARCVHIKDFVIARNNWGNILLQEAKEHESEHRFALLQQCIEQYKRAMELEPSNDGCVCRCAIAYLMSAEVRLKDLKRCQQSMEEVSNRLKYIQQQQLIYSSQPTPQQSTNAFGQPQNAQNAYGQYIQAQYGEEYNKLYNIFLSLAQQQHDLKMKCQVMYEQASSGFAKLKNKGLSLYNMSCLNAVFAKEIEAKKCLTEAYEYGYILTVDKLNEDSDFDSLRGCKWFQELIENLKEREANQSHRKDKHRSQSSVSTTRL